MLHQLTDLGTSQNKKNRAEERPCYNNYSDSDNAILFTAPAQNRSRSRSRASRSPLRLTHPSTANLPITVLLCNGPLLCGFNVPIKRLRWHRSTNHNDLLWSTIVTIPLSCFIFELGVTRTWRWIMSSPWNIG